MLFQTTAVTSGETVEKGAAEIRLDRPSNRATPAFVPRLGKRVEEYQHLAQHNNQAQMERLALLGALFRDALIDNAGGPQLVYEQQGDGGQLQLASGVSEPLQARWQAAARAMQSGHLFDSSGSYMARDTRASGEEQEPGLYLGGGAFGGTKRVAFTPRIGR